MPPLLPLRLPSRFSLSTTGFVDPGPANLVALTEGIHSKEALELVREHMLGVMGAAASNKFSTELIKMSKFQMAQVRHLIACVLGQNGAWWRERRVGAPAACCREAGLCCGPGWGGVGWLTSIKLRWWWEWRWQWQG